MRACDPPIVERVVTPRRVWPDEYLDAWGEVYIANPMLMARGVRFETFLYAPAEILDALRMPLPLVSVDSSTFGRKARLFQAALERMGACCSNGALIEKLRHNRMVRSRRRRRDSEGRLV